MDKQEKVDLVRVHDTLHFIEENYHRAISIKELERVSNYSYRNIQRIFKYACSETIGACQQRLKVENAYKRILYTRESLSSIALEVGFANLASFSKAFKQRFGNSPKEARAGKGPLFASATIVPVGADQTLQPEIIYVSRLSVYYRSAFLNYVHEDIESLWEQFMELGFPDQGNEYYGIIADEPLIRENLRCRYDTCSLLPSAKQELPLKTVQGGKYAQFTHPGSYETIEETYRQIYAGWILETKLEFAHRPIIEKYVKHPGNTADPEEQVTYIRLPLK
jgi:AraC family transcriptional regulator